jgi:hypothetical protein
MGPKISIQKSHKFTTKRSLLLLKRRLTVQMVVLLEEEIPHIRMRLRITDMVSIRTIIEEDSIKVQILILLLQILISP